MPNDDMTSETSWLEQNMMVMSAGNALGDCSACAFRNAPSMCDKMHDAGGCMHGDVAFYWIARQTYANINLCPGAIGWFSNTPIETISYIAHHMMENAVSRTQ